MGDAWSPAGDRDRPIAGVVPDRLVPRPRVVALLNRRFDTPIVAMVARAGFGKSTALYQAVAANQADPVGSDVMVPLSRRLRAPEALVRALATSLGTTTWDPDPFEGLEVLVEWSARQRWTQGVTLILDDVHLLRGSGGEQIVRRLVSRAGASLRVVLASRSPLLWLATHRARGDVVDLDEECLRLDDHELSELADRRGAELTALRQFAGWPAIVDLVATYGAYEADAFVNEEVLAEGPVDRAELAAIVAVEGGDASLLAAVLGRPVEPADIAANVPLTSLTTNGELVVHPLWRELLGGNDDDPARRARAIAAAELCRRRDHHRAVELALLAADEDVLTDALIGAFADPDLRPPARLVSDWLSRFPPELSDRPAGLLLRGADTVRRDPYGSRPDDLLEPVAATWRTDARPAGQQAVLRELVTAAHARGDRDRLAELRERASCAAGGRDPALEGLIDAAIAQLDAHTPHPPASTRGPSLLADLLGAPCTQGPQLADLQRREPELVRVIEAMEAWHRHDLAHAMAILPDPPVAGGRFDRYLASVTLARCESRAGRLDRARTALEAARGTAPPAGTAWAAELATARVALAAAEGDDRRATEMVVDLVGGAATDDRARALSIDPLLIGCLHPGGRELTDPLLAPEAQALRDEVRSVLHATGTIAPTRWPPGTELLARLPLRWVARMAAAATGPAPSVAGEIVAEIIATHGERGRRIVRTTDASSLLVRTAVRPTVALRLDLLGPVRLWRGDSEVDHPDWERVRVRELLCHLALHPSSSRDAVAAALWPDSGPEEAANNLRTHLSVLHGVLEPDRWPGEATWVVRVHSGRLELAEPPALTVDAHRLGAALARYHAGGGTGDLEAALSSWRGRPLADLGDSPWVGDARSDLVGELVEGSLALGAGAIAAGDPDRAVFAAIDTLQLDPWNEAGYQLLVSGYLAGGDRAAATRALERCDAMLGELGVLPDATTQALRRRLG